MRRTMTIDVKMPTTIITVIRTATARRWLISWKMNTDKEVRTAYIERAPISRLQFMMIPTLPNMRRYGSCPPMTGETASFPIHPASSKEDNYFIILVNNYLIYDYTRKWSTQLDLVIPICLCLKRSIKDLKFISNSIETSSKFQLSKLSCKHPMSGFRIKGIGL